jgi:hypothetical protein
LFFIFEALKEKLEAEKLAQKLGMIVEGKGSEVFFFLIFIKVAFF